jgi:hypothetical protein
MENVPSRTQQIVFQEDAIEGIEEAVVRLRRPVETARPCPQKNAMSAQGTELECSDTTAIETNLSSFRPFKRRWRHGRDAVAG